MLHFIWSLIKALCTLAVAAVLGAGLYIGNMTYNQLMDSPWDQILGIRNETADLHIIHEAEKKYGWRPVEVEAKDGTMLAGTYVSAGQDAHRTVILLHGLYSNRSMMVPLIPMYQKLGYNVLLVDLRGHGESGGEHTMWGMKEVDDLDAWMEWLEARDPRVLVGMHGISLGAAMSLLYSGTDNGQNLLFYVADSSYADLLSLGKEKVYAWSGDERMLLSMDIINPFFQAAMFIHTGKLLHNIEPIDAVANAKAPILFLHGAADTLVPPSAAQELGDAAGSNRKEIRIFEGAGHAAEYAANPAAYERIVSNFVMKS